MLNEREVTLGSPCGGRRLAGPCSQPIARGNPKLGQGRRVQNSGEVSPLEWQTPRVQTTVLIKPRKGRPTTHEAWVTTGERKEKRQEAPDVTRLHYGKDEVALAGGAFSMTKKRRTRGRQGDDHRRG